MEEEGWILEFVVSVYMRICGGWVWAEVGGIWRKEMKGSVKGRRVLLGDWIKVSVDLYSFNDCVNFSKLFKFYVSVFLSIKRIM